MKRYVKFDPAGAQFTGQLLCGLPQQGALFSTLPLYFCIDDDCKNKDFLVPVFDQFCTCFAFESSSTSSLFITSINFHYDFVKRTLLQSLQFWKSGAVNLEKCTIDRLNPFISV